MSRAPKKEEQTSRPRERLSDYSNRGTPPSLGILKEIDGLRDLLTYGDRIPDKAEMVAFSIFNRFKKLKVPISESATQVLQDDLRDLVTVALEHVSEQNQPLPTIMEVNTGRWWKFHRRIGRYNMAASAEGVPSLNSIHQLEVWKDAKELIDRLIASKPYFKEEFAYAPFEDELRKDIEVVVDTAVVTTLLQCFGVYDPK
jgi:hypothetical protein